MAKAVDRLQFNFYQGRDAMKYSKPIRIWLLKPIGRWLVEISNDPDAVIDTTQLEILKTRRDTFHSATLHFEQAFEQCMGHPFDPNKDDWVHNLEGSGKKNMRSLIVPFFKAAYNFRGAIDGAWESNNFKNIEVVEQAKRDHRIERRARWRMWIDQVFRWVLGIALAILLYSIAACLEGKYDFIKIPIQSFVKEVMDE